MNLFNQAELKAGAQRYGARENGHAESDLFCDFCEKEQGQTFREPTSGKRICEPCYQKLIAEKKNASPSARENATDAQCEVCGKMIDGDDEIVFKSGDVVVTTCSECADKFKRNFSQYKRTNSDSSTLGYQQTTSTTTARSKRKIGQKFYEVGKNASVETCKCDHPESQHVEDGTGFCQYCTCKQYRPGEAKPVKGRYDNAADMYVPPLLTVAQRVAAGQSEYGARNDFAAPGECRRCGTSKGGTELCRECTRQLKEMNEEK